MLPTRSLNVISRSRISPLSILTQSIRFNSSATSTTPKNVLKKNSKPKDSIGQVPSITKVGIPAKSYIPPSFGNLPSPITSPLLFIKCLSRRVGLLGLNTLQIVDFRRNLKPDFLSWKNEAIEQYVLVNKAFANRNLQSVRSSCTSFVYNALDNRLKSLPKEIELDWKLLKFNKVPKIVVFNNFPNEDGSTLCLQITYKFNTKQRLVTLNNGEVKTQDRDLIEYVAFNIDPYSNEVCLAGSSFESDPNDILYKRDQTQNQKEVVENMILHGDIYRSNPKLALESKK